MLNAELNEVALHTQPIRTPEEAEGSGQQGFGVDADVLIEGVPETEAEVCIGPKAESGVDGRVAQ
jgi:hypothetical protein